MEQLGKILIVDDNEDVLFALNLLLEPYAEKIKVAVTPDRIVNPEKPDVPLNKNDAFQKVQKRRVQEKR